MLNTGKQDENLPSSDRDRELIADARRQVEEMQAQQATGRTPPGKDGHGLDGEPTVTLPPVGTDELRDAVAHTDASPGTLPRGAIPGYQIIRRIHGGGQGVVYEAVQVATQRKVAVKVLNEGPFASPNSRERFKREIGLVAGLDHPHIVKVLDSGIAEGHYFYAMDYIRGGTLSEHVATGQSSIQHLLSLFAKICAAVQYAHRKGVIHRDLKPSNILVDHRGEPHLVDFGMAKVAGGSAVGKNKPMLISITGQVVGTLPYMSPEQAMGDPERVDARTDIYALGVILYQLLTGHFPYEVVGNMRDVLDNIIRAEPRPPSSIIRKIDNEVETIILKALSKEPERRYQSAEGLGRDLSHYLAGEAIEAKRASRWYVFRKSAQRHRRGLMTTTLIAVVVLIAGGYALESHREALRSAVEAKQARIKEKQATQHVKKAEQLLADQREEKSASQRYEAALAGLAKEQTQQPPKDRSLIQRDSAVYVNAPVQPKKLTPLNMSNRGEVFVCELLFERLFRRASDLSLYPNEHLISSIEDADGPRVKILRLQPNLTWHDDKPLTADDIVFSWQQNVNKVVGSSKRTSASQLTEVTRIDPRTVRFVFHEAQPTWRLAMNFELVPKHCFEVDLKNDPTLRTSDYYRLLHHNPIGCGPFKFVSWGDDEIVLERWEDYVPIKTHFKKLVIRWISDEKEKLQTFFDGGLDIFKLTNKQYADVIYTDDFTKIGNWGKWPGSNFYYIQWNCGAADRPFFHDRKVRQAMTMAMDLDRVIAQATQNLGTRCYGPWPFRSPFFNRKIKLFKHDLSAAAKLLGDNGWTIQPDALRGKVLAPGKKATPFKFTLLVYDKPISVKIARILKENLDKIGIRTNILRVGREGFFPRMKNGGFDAYIGVLQNSVDPDLWRSLYATGGALNYGHYSNPEIDGLFKQGARLLDPDKRAACYQKMHRILYDDQPMTFLFHSPDLWAQSHRLQGVELSIRGPYLFDPGIRNWWIPKTDGTNERF